MTNATMPASTDRAAVHAFDGTRQSPGCQEGHGKHQQRDDDLRQLQPDVEGKKRDQELTLAPPQEDAKS